jgi:hypothetical protein
LTSPNFSWISFSIRGQQCTVLAVNRIVLTIVELIDLGLVALSTVFNLILMMLNSLLVRLRGHTAIVLAKNVISLTNVELADVRLLPFPDRA